MSFACETSNYDELFSDSLKDLKNLSTQLYSAAEYFEYSYTNDDQKQIVTETLKDYAIRALVNTVDHLGSATYKVNDLVDEKVDEVSGSELRVSCIEQRVKTCHEYIDHQGISQQSLLIKTPKYHKRYILPVDEIVIPDNYTKSIYQSLSLDIEDELQQFQHEDVQSSIRETLSSSDGKLDTLTPSSPQASSRSETFYDDGQATGETTSSLDGNAYSPTLSQEPCSQPVTFSFTETMPKKEPEKRSVSPIRPPLLRSESVSVRETTPESNKPSSPKAFVERRRFPSELRNSVSMRVQGEVGSPKSAELHKSKSKRLLKALLSRRKTKKDEMLYTYLDEY